LGWGAGLYDAAFATLGQIYRDKARGPITTLTLFGGFSSTICWPLSGLLVESTGWRAACFFYAGLQLVVSLPIYLLLLQKSTGRAASQKSGAGEVIGSTQESSKNRFAHVVLVAAAITLSAIIQSTMGVHLLTILQAQGVKMTAAVALGTLVGPSQVLARVLEMIVGRHFHPIWTMLSSTVLVTTGLVLLSFHFPLIALGLVFFGAGMGIMPTARETVPLALFGAPGPGYAVLMGQLAAPSSVAQAISPLLGALVLESGGPTEILFALSGVALANVMLVGLL
jgi:hypothetical protein